MRHARPDALDRLEPLLATIRAHAALKEKSRGVFYRAGKAWLHFHEDPAGLFADLRQDGDWLRLRVSEPAEQRALLAAVDQALGAARP